MRIVGGTLRGRTIAAPGDGRVRPTADRVREALFNVLAHNDFGRGFALAGARVLDLFAGTGALGLEALSRGAAFCLFIDDHFASRALIRENVEAFGLTGASRIWRRDATRLGVLETGAPFGLAFLDPPYRQGLAEPALAAAAGGGWLAPSALCAVETAADEELIPPAGFTPLDTRLYGETKVTLLAAAGPA